MRFFGVAASLLISSNWLMGSQGSDSATAGEGASATAEEDGLSGTPLGVQREAGSATASVNISPMVLKKADLRRAPLLDVPSIAFNYQSTFLSSLTKDTVPTFVSISFTSKQKGLLRRHPSIDHCFTYLTGAIAMRSEIATATVTAVPTDRYCGDALHL